jgi:ribosomal protein L29
METAAGARAMNKRHRRNTTDDILAQVEALRADLDLMRAHIARGYSTERLYQINQYRQLIAQYERVAKELRHGTTR